MRGRWPAAVLLILVSSIPAQSPIDPFDRIRLEMEAARRKAEDEKRRQFLAQEQEFVTSMNQFADAMKKFSEDMPPKWNSFVNRYNSSGIVDLQAREEIFREFSKVRNCYLEMDKAYKKLKGGK